MSFNYDAVKTPKRRFLFLKKDNMVCAKFEKISKENFLAAAKISGASEAFDLISLPKRATQGSAGYDFFAPFNVTLKPNESATIPTGIRAKIKDGWALFIFPRSGLGFKFRLQLDNTVGVVDGDYYNSDNEGHIFVKLTNDGKEGKTVEIPRGAAFCQGVFLQYGLIEGDDANAARNGGFGSTDKGVRV